MRHTSLNTTTLYTRTVTERMKDAVKDLGKPLETSLGGKSGSNSLRKKTQNSTLVKLAIKELIARRAKGNSGGRSRNRTYDLAHVRHTATDNKLLELLVELLLEASAGDNRKP